MSIRTAVAQDNDVFAQVKQKSSSTGKSFTETLNDALRIGLLRTAGSPTRREFRIEPFVMGYRPNLNCDCIEALLEEAEGPAHR
jgi:hypothetical protein